MKKQKILNKNLNSKSKCFGNIGIKKIKKDVFLLQQKIAIAFKLKDLSRVKRLQYELFRSFSGRALAVWNVKLNKGSETAGVDDELWVTNEQLIKAIADLKNIKDYKAKPVRRVFIPKLNGTKRAIGIPTLFDRAMQCMFSMALVSISEETTDKCSYGFRPHRSIHDAASYLKLVLGSMTCNKRFIMKCDIEKYFDKISHEWILKTIPIDKTVLSQFLKAGYLKGALFYNTEEGVPQGGIISPIISNMVLDGMREALGKEFLFVRYADDFVVIGCSEKDLKYKALNKIESFLNVRGVSLNRSKTRIYKIEEGFEFLGLEFREYKDKSRAKGTKKGIFLIKPSKPKVLALRKEIKHIIKSHKRKPLYVVITKLNAILRGWAEHYRKYTSTRIFSSIGYYVWTLLWKLVKKRHIKVGKRKLKENYFTTIGGNRWVFWCLDSTKQKMLLFQIGWVSMQKHILCRAINPFLPENKNYFDKRELKYLLNTVALNAQRSRLLVKQKGVCPVCNTIFSSNCILEIHHILARKYGGSNLDSNLIILHKECHKQVTYSKNKKLKAVWISDGVLKN